MKLWLVGKSQPETCDKLFSVLEQQGVITDRLRWQRYSLALSNRQYTLARYLQKRIKQQPYRDWAANASAASRKPELMANYATFTDKSDETLAVIEHNIYRLSRTDAQAAMQHWQHYQQQHKFSMAAKRQTTERLIKALYSEEEQQLADQLLRNNLDMVSPALLEWRIRKAFTALEWQAAQEWIAQLPTELQQKSRWQYWQARLAEQLDGQDSTSIYQELSQSRSYYGFLSSERLGQSYEMEHSPVVVDEAAIQQLASQPGVQRTRELYIHGERNSARREWHYASRSFSERQFQLAAIMFQRWDWDNQSIASMIQASYWNDIELRFPLTYQQQMAERGEVLNIDSHLLQALARQESALAEDAVSHAGARGLMQLMPATARQTANKHGVALKGTAELLNPDKNIQLGSHYYKEMLDRFGNNKILATAAYNAGPHRVDRWLGRSAGQLDFDAWIETIPFKETRGYVQNVLAFSMIYAHLEGNKSRMLSESEKARLL